MARFCRLVLLEVAIVIVTVYLAARFLAAVEPVGLRPY